MKSYDREIKKILQDDTVKMDDEQKKRIDILLDNLPEKEICIDKKDSFRKTVKRRTGWKVAFAMLTALVVLPNVNPVVASAMYEIPLIGKFFEVVTVRNYEYQDETHEAKIKTPEIVIVHENEESIEKINKESREFVDLIIGEFEANLKEDSYQSVYVDYDVLCDSEEWFTLKLSVSEVMASSNEYYKYYHINKVTGDFVTLDDLFADNGYIEAISQNIYDQMAVQMKNTEDNTISYWIETADEAVEACYKIEKNQNFYWNQNGEIVIVYDKYVVGPGSMGCPEFAVPVEVYREYLR